MSDEIDLENWRRQWQGGPPAAPRPEEIERLRQRVLRETRWLKVSLIAPIFVTFGVGGGTALIAMLTQQTTHIVIAIESWIFIAVCWMGSLWLARGTWRPLADTTAAFVDVSIRRRKANMRGAAFGMCLYVVELLFVVFIVAFHTNVGLIGVLKSPQVIVVGWIGMPAVFAALYWFRRRQRAELERLLELKRQLEGD